MSELNKHILPGDFRRQLLVTVSALSLMAAVTSEARAEDESRPTVWVELGGQMEMTQGTGSNFSAPFMSIPSDIYDDNIFTRGQHPSRTAFGLEGKVTFQPEESDWVFSAALRYGRTNTNRRKHLQGAPPTAHKYAGTLVTPLPQYAAPFGDTRLKSDESHMVLDFKAGRDVGVGAFGRDGSSTISAGVRFAQFSTASDVHNSARPAVGLKIEAINAFFSRQYATFEQFFQTASAKRNFHGVGPSLSWDASAVVVGNPDRGELTFDWGVDGAILFGRQRAITHHGTKAYHEMHQSLAPVYPQLYTPRNYDSARSRTVVVPNLGGFAGVSVKYPNVKVSLGYRADFFFGATDTGIDARRTKDLGFFGPFATVSIGLGG